MMFAAGLLSMAVLFSRCSSNNAADSSSTAPTTFSISGTMDVGQTAASLSTNKLAKMDAAMSMNDVNAQATQCSDGYYYNVYCVSYSEPPASATGVVTCTGGSGAFTVAGLPLNAEIGCFVRRSADNATYATLGTIEIPTTSLSGGTTSIVSQGNLQLAISLNTDGSITTEVTDGGSNVVTPVAEGADVNTSQYTGIWQIKCDTTATGDLVDPIKCLCKNAGEKLPEYQPGGSKNPNPTTKGSNEACILDSASLVTADQTKEYVELNMYTATPASSIIVENGTTIPAGTVIPVISVWSASSSTDSSRAGGGEGASATVKDKNGGSVSLTWNVAQATDAILWATSGTKALGNNVSVDLTAATTAQSLATTMSTGTSAAWKAWVKAMYDNSTGFTCTWDSGGNSNTAGCLAEFADRVIRENRGINLPSVHIERNCNQAGCDTSVANARIFVDGYHANYSAISWGSSTDAVVLTQEGVSPRVRNRFVFEPFEATPTGGGFTQHEFHNRGYRCATAAGAGIEVVDSTCTGTDGNFVNCGIREETTIRFKPSSTTEMKIFFESRKSVTYASLDKWSTGAKTSGTFSEAMAICNAQMPASESRFQMAAAKQ